MLALIGLLVLLQFFRPDPFEEGAWLRICVYGVMGFVCPAAIIPVGVCWFSCWLIREMYRDHKAKVKAKRDQAAGAVRYAQLERQRELDEIANAEWRKQQALESQKRFEAECAEWGRLNPPGKPRWTDPHKSHGFG